MRVYCYHIRDANNGQKLVGGTVHADTMEEAAIRVARRDELVMETESHRVVLWRRDRRVNLYLTIHPEYVLADHIPSFETIPESEEIVEED